MGKTLCELSKEELRKLINHLCVLSGTKEIKDNQETDFIAKIICKEFGKVEVKVITKAFKQANKYKHYQGFNVKYFSDVMSGAFKNVWLS